MKRIFQAALFSLLISSIASAQSVGLDIHEVVIPGMSHSQLMQSFKLDEDETVIQINRLKKQRILKKLREIRNIEVTRFPRVYTEKDVAQTVKNVRISHHPKAKETDDDDTVAVELTGAEIGTVLKTMYITDEETGNRTCFVECKRSKEYPSSKTSDASKGEPLPILAEAIATGSFPLPSPTTDLDLMALHSTGSAESNIFMLSAGYKGNPEEDIKPYTAVFFITVL